VCFGINRGVGQFAFLTVFLMSDAAACAKHGTIDGDGSPAGGPELDQIKQMPTQTANLGRQCVRKG
jgi:hypothetical protein